MRDPRADGGQIHQFPCVLIFKRMQFMGSILNIFLQQRGVPSGMWLFHSNILPAPQHKQKVAQLITAATEFQ